MSFFKQIYNDLLSRFSIVIEDDGRVAYAYLLDDNTVVGDVWLYNNQETPEDIEWNKENMPFLNPKEYVKEEILPISDDSDIHVEWEVAEDADIEAKVFLRETLIAKLAPFTSPGWSLLVEKDGPLAKRLEQV